VLIKAKDTTGPTPGILRSSAAPFHHVEAIHGGDLCEILRIALADGRDAIVKNGPAPKTEAAMLSAIAASGAPAPAVLAVSDEALARDALPRSRRRALRRKFLEDLIAFPHVIAAETKELRHVHDQIAARQHRPLAHARGAARILQTGDGGRYQAPHIISNI
jgi:hypothetical protein